jgi:hypothetical protein
MRLHWRRSVLFLGKPSLEKSMQAELASHFPQDQFPVNIAVVGVKDQDYYAMIQVYDFETGIEENVTADLGDLLGSNPPAPTVIETTVIETIERVISGLRESGKLFTSSQ